MQIDYEVSTRSGKQSKIVRADCPLSAAKQISEEGCFVIKNIETGTICLVDFDLVKTWKDII